MATSEAKGRQTRRCCRPGREDPPPHWPRCVSEADAAAAVARAAGGLLLGDGDCALGGAAAAAAAGLDAWLAVLSPDAARGVEHARRHQLGGAGGGLPAQPCDGGQRKEQPPLSPLLGGSAPRPIGAPALGLAAVALPGLGALRG